MTSINDGLPVWAPEQDPLTDRAIGSLVAGAIGDGLGGPVEGRSRETIVAQFGLEGVTDLPPWGAAWSDDTQLTVIVAQSLIACGGRFEPGDFVGRLVDWLPTGRGVGHATRQAVVALAAGEPWDQVGPRIDSSGNGAAMRAAPVGLVHALEEGFEDLRVEAARFAVPTHGGSIGIAGAVAMAVAVGDLAARSIAGARHLDPAAFASLVADQIADLEPAPTPTRKPPHVAEYLRDRIRRIPDHIGRSPADYFDEIWTGAFALESVPAAIFSFLRSPEDPRAVLLTAANSSHDTDTIASMAGNLIGAWLGAERLKGELPEWWGRVERRAELEEAGVQLAQVARFGRAATA